MVRPGRRDARSLPSSPQGLCLLREYDAVRKHPSLRTWYSRTMPRPPRRRPAPAIALGDESPLPGWASIVGGDETLLQRCVDGASAGFGAELFEDPLEMELDGILREIQGLTDGFVRAAVAQLAQHGELAAAEAVLLPRALLLHETERLGDEVTLGAGEHQLTVAPLREQHQVLEIASLLEKDADRALGGDVLEELLQARQRLLLSAAALEGDDGERIEPVARQQQAAGAEFRGRAFQQLQGLRR